MARIREDRTYRVRQLPSHIDSNHLPALLISVENSTGPLENINVHSLAGSLNTFEDVPTKTATVTFGAVPTAFDNDQTEWVLQTRRLGLQRNIIFDTHFLGFTALNDVDPNVHALDCIAISGLASHPFGSWKQRDEGNTKSNFMWLRDQLPRDLKQIRSILYGYDTKLLMSESFQTVEDLALSFIARLDSIGRSSLSARPLVVLAHSLGGIVLKRALVEMANGNTKQNFMLDAIRMVILFGVPNRGMRMSHLLPMVEGKPNTGLVEILSQESTYLTKLDEQFNGITLLRKIRLVSVIETARTRVPVQSVEGEWSKNGPFEILVDRVSAIQHQSTESDIIPINHDHSSLVKFPENNPDYYIIAGKLRDAAGDLTRESLRKELNSGLNDGKRPAFDPWSFVSSLSSPFPWKRKAKTLEMGNPDAPHHTLYRQDPETLQRFHVEAISVGEVDKHAKEASNIQKMICSLQLNETEDRWREIDENYGSTFEWLWTRNDLGFRSWLQEDHGGYWISGKPGSGKSTLMKYIYSRCKNENDSQTLTRRQGQFCIGFFFHNRGSFVQKSFEGLLHSILHQILTLEPRLGEEILPVYLRRRDLEGNTWLLKDLMQAFSRVLEQEIIPVDICLFLDALDEYNGPPENIAGFVQSIIARPDNHATKVKICFSSRPWNSFVDRFRSCNGFKIHEHTRQDIQKYISGRLADNPSTAMLLASENVEITKGVAELSLEIMEAAEGVFLWLKFVMDDLVKAHAEGASLRELAQHLSAFPRDLEHLYRNIIQRIPYDFRQESYWMLEIVLRSNGRLGIQKFMDCLICAPCETLKECVEKLDLESPMLGTPDSIIRRLKSRCGGLIELVDRDGMNVLQFMHQTVKDFISLPGFQKLITHEENILTEQNGYTLLSKSAIAFALFNFQKLHHDRTKKKDPRYWVAQLWDANVLLHKAEVSMGRSQWALLDEADRAMSCILEHDSYLPDHRLPFNSILSLCVASNLYLYVQETLQKRYVKSKPPVILLHCTILSASYDFSKYHTAPADLGQMTSLLLSHGADLKALWKGFTPFQQLFESWSARGESMEAYSLIFPTVSAMLSGGQDPNEVIPVPLYLGRKWVSLECKAIHVADHKLAQLLLQYNVDVNAVDELGHTALDSCLFKLASPRPREMKQDILEVALLLRKNGACIAKAAQVDLDTITHKMKLSGYCRADIDCVSSAPRLSMKRRIIPRISEILKRKNG